MFVNKERLKELISGATVYCENCPIYEESDWTACDKYRQKMDKNIYWKNCEEALLDWLQEFDIAEALEEGAHIVNDQVIFPPVSLPDNFKLFTLNLPCDSKESCTPSCPWYNKCPFEDD